MLPTLLAAAGDPDVKEKLLNGYKVGDKTFKVHHRRLQHASLPDRRGEGEPENSSSSTSATTAMFMAVRNGDWKFVLMRAARQADECWVEPFVKLRVPQIFNLRRDPFERADYNSNTYWDWMVDHAFLIYEMQAIVAGQIDGFRQVPAAPKAGLVQPGRGAGDAAGGLRRCKPLGGCGFLSVAALVFQIKEQHSDLQVVWNEPCKFVRVSGRSWQVSRIYRTRRGAIRISRSAEWCRWIFSSKARDCCCAPVLSRAIA